MTTTGAESFGAFHSPDHESAPAARTSTSTSTSRHSEVAYLFGGIASMVGLIGLAILILACAYWNLSGRFDGGGDGEDVDEEVAGERKNEMNGSSSRGAGFEEEKILVIMAGDEKPTFIATPMITSSSRASSFASSQADQEKSSRHHEDDDDKVIIRPLEEMIRDHHNP